MFKNYLLQKKKRYLYLLNRVTGSTSVRRNKSRALTPGRAPDIPVLV